MLRPPHTRYRQIHTYHFDRPGMPELDDPDCIGVWDEGETSIYFFHTDQADRMAEMALRHKARLVYTAAVAYEDWEAGTMPSPFCAGGLRISPVWSSGEADLVIDPSVVFGSGFHPTTRLCIEALALMAERFRPRSMLDCGTGSGILALCGARLGIGRVTAVDANRLACRVATANAQRNGLDHWVTVHCLDLARQWPDPGAELVVANLHRALLCQLLPRLVQGGHQYAILAGFRAAEEADLLPLFPARHFILIDRWRSDAWALWLLRRRPTTGSQEHDHAARRP